MNGEFLRLYKRVLSILLLIFCVFLNTGIPLSAAQERSELEIVIGTSDNDVAMDMVVDSTGNVIVVGRSQQSTDPSVGMFYAVKISSSGETLWTKLWNLTASDILTGVAVDSADNILMIGACNLTTDQVFGVIYKFDSNGEELWSIQIDNINYVWYQLYHTRYCLDVQMNPASNDFFVVGSVNNTQYKMFVSRYNASGSLVWYTDWYGPPEYMGSISNLMWLSSQNRIIIAGQLSEDLDSFPTFDRPFLTAIDFNGTQLWNYTTGYHSAAFEYDSDEYIYATYDGRAFDHIVRRTYDFDETWNFDMIIDDLHSVVVSGFLANGTDNLIGYGEVTSLIAEQAVVKSFHPAFSGFQPPQTLIFSFTSDGSLLWYDYLVLGRISTPCGCEFDSDNRLIVAGHTSYWGFDTCDFYIVFDFIQTPFPSHYDDFAIFTIPIFNLLALISAWGIERVRSMRFLRTSLQRVTLRNVTRVLLVSETVLCVMMYLFLVGSSGGGSPPPPLVYFPYWVRYFLIGLFYGLGIPAIVSLAIWFRKKRAKQG